MSEETKTKQRWFPYVGAVIRPNLNVVKVFHFLYPSNNLDHRKLEWGVAEDSIHGKLIKEIMNRSKLQDIFDGPGCQIRLSLVTKAPKIDDVERIVTEDLPF